MLLAPREVCASAVKTADPANSNAIARVSVTLRISFLCRDVPHLAVPRPPILPSWLFWSTAEYRGLSVKLKFDPRCRFEPKSFLVGSDYAFAI